MSDQNKFINTYIDNAIGLIHEQITNTINLKTQLKLSQDALAEKDGVIESLNSKIVELEESANKKSIDDAEYTKAITNAKSWEQSYNAMVNKVSHMDTLLKQVGEMKRQLKEKDQEIESLKSPVKKKTSTKKQINKQETPVLVELIDNDKQNDNNKDDF